VTSAYGLTLSVKMVMVLPVLVAGLINHRIVRPNLLRLAGTPGLAASEAVPWVRRFGRMLELEVTAGVLVVTIAGIVGSISPPGGDGSLRLTPRKLDAVLTPVLPRTTLVDPSQFVGAATRTVDDLRYAELMHNWSGIFVTALGLLWLAQGLGGRSGGVAARAWPLLLVPLAVFIAVFADPEVWVLRAVTFREAIGDPGVVEHQIGAVLVLVLAWLGWRDRRRPPRERPLGPALPVLMIAGSLLLLGHAHAGVRTTEELGTLINVQHGVLGALGLFAGTVRWLSLRGSSETSCRDPLPLLNGARLSSTSATARSRDVMIRTGTGYSPRERGPRAEARSALGDRGKAVLPGQGAGHGSTGRVLAIDPPTSGLAPDRLHPAPRRGSARGPRAPAPRRPASVARASPGGRGRCDRS
jgi:hypothetical protein